MSVSGCCCGVNVIYDLHLCLCGVLSAVNAERSVRLFSFSFVMCVVASVALVFIVCNV